MLRSFIASNRGEILTRARSRVEKRRAPVATAIEINHGLPAFLDQLSVALLRASTQEVVDHAAIHATASDHGSDLFEQGVTADQAVHDYGDLCQVVTGLAVEQSFAIPASDFQTFNLCLDDAIAGAVTAFAKRRERAISDDDTERLGELAHEMRDAINSALLAFGSIKNGTVAPGGSTGAMLERNLIALQALVDRSLANVRLDAGLLHSERLPVWEIFEEVAIGGVLIAGSRGLHLAVAPVAPDITVVADRQILAAAIANLLQNAFKFTAPSTTVSLRATTTEGRVHIEVEDECGGLPPGRAESLLQPFTQEDENRTGLGLGLHICAKAMKMLGGELRVHDLPGKGCVFTIDLPRAPSRAPG